MTEGHEDLSWPSDDDNPSGVDLDDYGFVTMAPHGAFVSGDLFMLFDKDTNYQYTCFDRLMKTLEIHATGSEGFWHNRSMILTQMPDLTIVVERDTRKVVAFYIISKDSKGHSCVDFLQVFSPGRGLGSALMRREMRRPHLYVGVALESSREFWRKVGIPCRMYSGLH